MVKSIKIRKKAFSLIELVIAIAVLVIGLVAILQVFPVSLKAGKKASMSSKATFIAQEKIESLKIIGYKKIIAEPPPMDFEGETDNIRWKISVSKTTMENIPETVGVCKVIIKVSWKDGNRTLEKDFVTYISENS